MANRIPIESRHNFEFYLYIYKYGVVLLRPVLLMSCC